MSGSRRQSRELALQIVFQQEFTGGKDPLELENFRSHFNPSADVWDYTLGLIDGVNKHRSTIDSTIQGASAHWALKRMALVDLNIMRVAVFEAKYAAEPLPPPIVLNEAIEIARKFGSVDSPSFVNGILDQVVKQ